MCTFQITLSRVPNMAPFSIHNSVIPGGPHHGDLGGTRLYRTRYVEVLGGRAAGTAWEEAGHFSWHRPMPVLRLTSRASVWIWPYMPLACAIRRGC